MNGDANVDSISAVMYAVLSFFHTLVLLIGKYAST